MVLDLIHCNSNTPLDQPLHGLCVLAGILEKLDHFQYLNIKSVWVGPVYRSPMKDFGYDVEDFRDIDPLYGTMQDFEDLLAEMHNRGVCVCGGSDWRRS